MKKHYIIGIICTIYMMVNLLGCGNNIDENLNYYQNKVWIGEYEELNGEKTTVSFIITKIDNNIVEGNFCFDKIIVPESYSLKYDKKSQFVGKLYRNNITFTFNDKAGNVKQIGLFLQEESIYGEISNLYEKNMKNNELSQRINFNPYNLDDLKNLFDSNREIKKKIILEEWGEVYFVSEIVDYENKIYSIAYLVDKEENILYCFPVYTFAAELTGIRIEDIDGNSRNDIILQGDFYDGISTDYIYFQMENGWFLSKGQYNLNVKKKNIQKQVEPVDLSAWGTVNLVLEKYEDNILGEIQTIYIEDIDGNVLYQFPINYLGPYQMDEYELMDINQDGLTDIRVLYYDENDKCQDEKIFYQLNNGWFLEK